MNTYIFWHTFQLYITLSSEKQMDCMPQCTWHLYTSMKKSYKTYVNNIVILELFFHCFIWNIQMLKSTHWYITCASFQLPDSLWIICTISELDNLLKTNISKNVYLLLYFIHYPAFALLKNSIWPVYFTKSSSFQASTNKIRAGILAKTAAHL